nr:hypothetical protein [Lachnospiraceae bacterium]
MGVKKTGLKTGLRYVLTMPLMLMLSTGGCGTAAEDMDLPAAEIKKGNAMNGVSCHDPQILPVGERYYMTGSHQVLAYSDDLIKWNYINKEGGTNMFSNIYSGDMPAFSYVGKNDQGGYSVWASNIVFNEKMGKYLMYFCTTSTYIKSALTLAVSDKPEGPYEYTTTFLYSGFEKSNIDQTNLYEVLGEDADVNRYLRFGGYNNDMWPNCIDPAVMTDKDGTLWMVYGSWSG